VAAIGAADDSLIRLSATLAGARVLVELSLVEISFFDGIDTSVDHHHTTPYISWSIFASAPSLPCARHHPAQCSAVRDQPAAPARSSFPSAGRMKNRKSLILHIREDGRIILKAYARSLWTLLMQIDTNTADHVSQTDRSPRNDAERLTDCIGQFRIQLSSRHMVLDLAR
jgi:hypothetical protein